MKYTTIIKLALVLIIMAMVTIINYTNNKSFHQCMERMERVKHDQDDFTVLNMTEQCIKLIDYRRVVQWLY